MSQTHSDTASCASSATRRPLALKRCVECRIPVSMDCSPGVCDTCIDIRLGKKVRCKCGNKYFQSYRPATMPQQSCVMCMVRGIAPVKSDKQKKMIAEYEICSGGCDMPRRMNISCRYCAALHCAPNKSTVVSNKSTVQQSALRPVIDLSSFVEHELAAAKQPVISKTTTPTPTPTPAPAPVSTQTPVSTPVVVPKVPAISTSSTSMYFTADVVTKLRNSVGASQGQSFVIVFVDPSDSRSVSDVIRSVQQI